MFQSFQVLSLVLLVLSFYTVVSDAHIKES